MTDEQIDVAIVGAGVSGVYTAWRLKEAHPSKRIVLFESSNRIGGRLLTVTPPDIPGIVAELGGMRILPAVQPRIAALIDTLNERLPPEERIETYDFPVDQPQNIAYLRGTHLRLADFTSRPDAVPYRLLEGEHGQSPGGLLLYAVERIVPGITAAGLTDLQRREMARHARFDGVPLYQQGFWNVLMRVISTEGHQFGVDAGGYETTLSNWNCADAIPGYLSDYGITPKYKAFHKGFQQVPLALAALFSNAGGDVRLETPLLGFDKGPNGYTLRFSTGVVAARTLILAMPRRSLDLIMPSSPPLQAIQDDIHSVTPQALFKLFTTYSHPWWRTASPAGTGDDTQPLQAGRTVTDLPLRQVYYWPGASGQPAASGPSMLMASYDDGSTAGFWRGMRGTRHGAHKVTEEPFIGEHEAVATRDWLQYRAPKRMVAEVTRQLQQIHGLSSTPPVRNAVFHDWVDDPFGGGANFWNIGVKSWEVKERMVHPMDGLHICGEAYSDGQGWVEGALQTADMVVGRLVGW